MNLSLIFPSRNGVEFLEWSYNSIRKNQGNHHVEILVLDDKSDKDNTWEWCLKTMEVDPLFKAFRNEGPDRLGISGGHKFLSKHITTSTIGHFHNDFFLTEGTLDLIEQALQPNTVVCLTRIEPSIGYREGPEKIIWEDAPKELEDWDEDVFLNELPKFKRMWGNKTTGGHFAPFFMFTEEYNRIGGVDDVVLRKQGLEDSDLAFRLALGGFKTLQIPAFVFHFCSRGSRRQKYETGVMVDNPEWIKHNNTAIRNFIRKWQTFHLHDEWLQPYKPNRFNVGFNIINCTPHLLQALEPWCDDLQCDLNKRSIDEYIHIEQPNTTYCQLTEKINCNQSTDIKVNIDGQRFNQGDFNNIMNLSYILDDSGEVGEFEIGNLKLIINSLTHYENDLIVARNS